MPLKEWREIEQIFATIGLKRENEKVNLTHHEIDAITAVLTAYLYLENQTELIGDEEGYIIVPTKCQWRTVKL